MGMHYQDVKKWRIILKKRLVLSFGGKCAICSLIDDHIVYDFHHLDGSLKEFMVSSKIRSWDKMVVEAKKCVMLCSHCHRKVHSGLASIPHDSARFNGDLLF